MEKGLIYYTDNRLNPKVAEKVRQQLLTLNLPIVSASLEPLDFGDSFTLPLKRGYLTMFKQILTCLENSTADIVYFCEHDVLYHPSHFDFTPPTKDKFYYDLNWWKVRHDGLAVHWDAVQVSGLCCHRPLALDWYRKRIESFDEDNFDRKFEPTVDDEYETWRSPHPHIDIRHGSNLTFNKWKLEHFRNKDTAAGFEQSTIGQIPGWSLTTKDIYP